MRRGKGGIDRVRKSRIRLRVAIVIDYHSYHKYVSVSQANGGCVSDGTKNTNAAGMLEGKTVMVTGAASGIGRATCLLAAEEGARGIVATDRDNDGLVSLETELKARGTDSTVVAGELNDAELASRLVGEATATFGGFDAAVNNAGIRGTLLPLAEMDDAVFEQVIDVNLRSVYRCMRAQLPHLYARGGGSIVNVASATLFGASAGLGPYAASKMGVLGLSKVASKEAGPFNVRVNVVAPGRTNTPLFRSHALGDSPEDAAALVAPIPLGRFAEPIELAQAIVFLCSDRASFITGSTLVVDGGRTG
jgi:A-factor type gamma-butyrolactone 1'-reductase (1S-forming)